MPRVCDNDASRASSTRLVVFPRLVGLVIWDPGGGRLKLHIQWLSS